MTKLEREIRRRERERLRRVNKDGFHVFKVAMQIVLVALAIIIGITIWFWAAEQQALDVQASVLRSHRVWDGPMYGQKVTMVEPLPDFPPVDGEPPQAIEIKMATRAEAVPEEHQESIGRFKCTFYCPCRKCSGKWGYRTASGARCQENLTVAVDPKVIPLGTHLMINGKEYIAQDTGVKGHWIDIFMESHQECLRNGVQYHEVFVLR